MKWRQETSSSVANKVPKNNANALTVAGVDSSSIPICHKKTPYSLFDIWLNCFCHPISKFDQSTFPGGLTAAVALGAPEPAVHLYNVISLNRVMILMTFLPVPWWTLVEHMWQSNWLM